MKTFRPCALTAFVILLCFSLHSAGHAQATETVTVSTPAQMTPPDPNTPPVGTTYEYYSSNATPHTSGSNGEFTTGDETYLWTATITRWQSGSAQSSSGYVPCNAPIAFKFPIAPYPDVSTSPSTDVQTQFLSSGYYQITMKVKMTYDIRDQYNHVVTAGLTATGSATGQLEVVVPDFSIDATGSSLIIPLEGSAPVAVTATPINNFTGDIQLSLNASNPDPGQTYPAPNPVGVTLGSSATDPNLTLVVINGTGTASPMLHVAANAPTGTLPLTIWGLGSDVNSNGPLIDHYTGGFTSNGLPIAQLTVTIPKRYAEITCPPYDPNNNSIAGVPHQRDPIDGSIYVDAAAVWIKDPLSTSTGGWYGSGPMSTQYEQGFTNLKTYAWSPIFGGHNADMTGTTYGGVNGNTFLLNDELTTSFQAGQALSKTSAVNLVIKNYPGSLPYSTSYIINWHYPYENWHRQTSGTAPFVYDNPSYEIYPSSEWVAAGLSVNVTDNIPTSNINDNFNLIVGGVVGTTSAGIGTVTGGDLVGLSNPVTGAAVTLLAAASFAVSIVPTNARGAVPFLTGKNDFLDSVLLQQYLVANPGSTYYFDSAGHQTPILDPNAQRIDPNTVRNITTANPTNPADPTYYGNIWTGVVLGPLQVKVAAGRYRGVATFYGDHYGPNGYIGSGPVTDVVHYPGSYDCVYQWQIGSIIPSPITK